ncbi:uncharacterized protein [Mytilus edulis]|uniref:uncharacterized protein n=1 Tax=Mytilus edulis TaxID=6550 RepID=UPI0039F10645
MDTSVDLTEEEVRNIIAAFKDMHMKPNAESPDAFKDWMKEFSTQKSLYTGYIPKIPTFSGDNKGDNTYEVWRYQVLCLIIENYAHEVIAQAIRRSLRGEPSKIVMRLGPKATVDDIIDKMDSIYGIVDQKEAFLAQFYTARQEQDEDVSTWGCRLEEIYNKARRQGKIYEEDAEDMLRSMFWKGLKPELKRISGYKFDTIKDFNHLLLAMRELEHQQKEYTKENTPQIQKKPIPAKRANTPRKKDKNELETVVKQLMSQIELLEKRQEQLINNSKHNRTDLIHQIPDETIAYRPLDMNKRREKHQKTCWRCGQLGPIAIGCKVRLDNSRKFDRAMNYQLVTNYYQPAPTTYNKEDRLCGPANEVSISINGIDTKALLDTGSSVSTISESFYNMRSTPIESLTRILKIECADGLSMPYLGYIEADLQLHGISSTRSSYPGIFLVIPDSEYNMTVPLLIGTNIMSVVMQEVEQNTGPRYLQEANLHTPWYLAFRCMNLRNKELERCHNRLAVVKSAETHAITIPANSQVVINGYLDKQLQQQQMCAILQPTLNSALPEDLDIMPTVITYDCQQRGSIPIHISNVTTRTVTLQPRALICEIQPVDIEDIVTPEEKEFKDIMKDIKLPMDDLTDDDYERGKELIHRYQDIFFKGDDDIGHTSAVRHRIDLIDNVPFKQRHRRIPPSMLEEVRNHLQQLLSAGVIRRSHSPWSSNVVLVRKKDGKLRMCVDYRQLNLKTIKDLYALPRIEEILDSLGGNTYFTVLDMKSGYHQVEIEEEHKQRTAFTVGPLGFFEFNRLPFGLSNAPATYQRLMEECLGDLHTRICYIYLDDLIIFSKSIDEHLVRLERIFQRLRDVGLKLSPKKCSFLQRRVKYIGHIVSADGVEPYPEKVEKAAT